MLKNILFIYLCVITEFITASRAVYAQDNQENRAIWLSFPYWDLAVNEKVSLAKEIAKAGVNTAYLAVYGSARVRWPSEALKKLGLKDIQNNDEFTQGVNILRSNGLRVVPWFEAGLSVYESTGFPKENQDFLQKCGKDHRSGEYGGKVMSFLDPTNQKAILPILDALKELANHPLKFNEIQLDRFRYTRGNNKRLCKTADGTSNKQHINELVKKAYEAIKSVRPEIIVSASPVTFFGGLTYNQDWVVWAKEGYIDAISGQVYTRPINIKACKKDSPKNLSRSLSLALFKAELAQWTRKLNSLPKDFKFTAGIMAERFDDSQCMLDQIIHARSKNIKNFALWVSKIKPESTGQTNPHIENNLIILKETNWGKNEKR